MSESLFDRDEVCRQDVSRMAELGRFGEEFTFMAVCSGRRAAGGIV